MQAKEAKEIAQGLIDEGLVSTWDEAVHFLVDCGEIDSVLHEELLTDEERNRIYG
jgi:hypothetical protein